MPEFNPLICEKCGRDLESDDAISVIEGVCAPCRSVTGLLVQPLCADQMMVLKDTETESQSGELGNLSSPVGVEIVSGSVGIESQSSFAPPPERVIPIGSAISAPMEPSASSGAASTVHRHESGFICPPAPPFRNRLTSKHHRRKRDLTVGISIGLIVTLMATGYFLYWNSLGEDPARFESGEPARLKLRVLPVDAVVTLDGERAGQLNSSGRLSLSVSSDDLDQHWLEISAPGYFPVRQPLGIYQGAPEALIELVHVPYEVRVVTNPPDAEIWIDDELQGRSPLTMTLNSPRIGRLTALHKGYVEVSREIEPPIDGQPLELNLNLEQSGVYLTVTSQPKNAVLRIDGVAQGVTPLDLELDPTYLGRTIELTAAAEGYDDVHLRTTLPEIGGGDDISIGLVLSRAMSLLEVHTDPPGGRVVIAGKDFGRAPVSVEFESDQTGKSLVIEASLGGTHFGREALSIPPAGEPVRLTIPLLFSAQRVVFVLASQDCAIAEHYRLIERLTRRIHALQPSQRFAVVAATDDGVEIWPGHPAFEDASSEQKVRAYDQVRSIRPSGLIDHSELLDVAKALGPTTICMFLGGELNREGMERFESSNNGAVISVNVVRATSAPDDAWLDSWTARHHGTLMVMDRVSYPVLAMDENAER